MSFKTPQRSKRGRKSPSTGAVRVHPHHERSTLARTRGAGLHLLRRRVTILALLAFAIGCFAVLKIGSFMDENASIEVVEVTGSRQYSNNSEIMKIINAYIGKGIFTIQMNQMKQNLLNVKWIKEVSLRREPPNKLIVEIIEHTPVAHWESTEQNNTYIDSDGVVFERFEKPKKELPLFSGEPSNVTKMMAMYKTLLQRLINTTYTVKKVHFNTRHEWVITLNNDVTIKYLDSDSTQSVSRLLLALNVIDAGQMNAIDVIDLRYKYGFTVKWGDGTNA